MAVLTYFNHASMKLITQSGAVVYIDPFAPGDYKEEADIILITHEHFDHIQTDLVPKKADTVIIRPKDALTGGEYKSFSIKDISIRAVPACNKNHKREECVGYVIEVDNVKLYHAGDTSKIDDMAALKPLCLDYAFLPIDGMYNMDAKEGAECADIIGAKHSVPIHTCGTSGGEPVYSEENVSRFTCDSRLIIRPMESVKL